MKYPHGFWKRPTWLPPCRVLEKTLLGFGKGPTSICWVLEKTHGFWKRLSFTCRDLVRQVGFLFKRKKCGSEVGQGGCWLLVVVVVVVVDDVCSCFVWLGNCLCPCSHFSLRSEQAHTHMYHTHSTPHTHKQKIYVQVHSSMHDKYNTAWIDTTGSHR